MVQIMIFFCLFCVWKVKTLTIWIQHLEITPNHVHKNASYYMWWHVFSEILPFMPNEVTGLTWCLLYKLPLGHRIQVPPALGLHDHFYHLVIYACVFINRRQTTDFISLFYVLGFVPALSSLSCLLLEDIRFDNIHVLQRCL